MDFFTDKDKKVRPIGEGTGIGIDDKVEESKSEHNMDITTTRAEILNKKAKRRKVTKEEFDKDVTEGNGENVQVIE